MTTVDGVEMRDLHRTVIEYFADPLHTAWYVFAMAMMALHLGHGFQSTFQSLGWRHPKYTPAIKKIGLGFAVVVSLGFAAISAYCFNLNA
jgi:succinate dehydrogenase / fumarate reductase cytochrome b subunit